MNKSMKFLYGSQCVNVKSPFLFEEHEGCHSICEIMLGYNGHHVFFQFCDVVEVVIIH
jgi:hypothetical protein